MKIRWNGHSSFTIISEDNTIIVTDPYEPGSFGGGIGYGKIDVDPDIVTISHNHSDHNFIAGFAGDFKVIRETGIARGIQFDAVPVFHDMEKGGARGQNNIFCFTVDGVRICHLGDLGHVLGEDQVSALGKVDVLLIPVGGFYTIDANQAADILEKVRPGIVIPMHYKTEKCGFPIAEVTAFTSGKQNVRQINSDEIQIFAGKLPGEPEILVLKHRL